VSHRGDHRPDPAYRALAVGWTVAQLLAGIVLGLNVDEQHSMDEQGGSVGSLAALDHPSPD
jgi:hypothetical protein